MKFKMFHENYNVQDLQKSMDFYQEAFGLTEVRRKEAKDGSYIIVYLSNEESDFCLHRFFCFKNAQIRHVFGQAVIRDKGNADSDFGQIN